jgi:hypothetical protein
LLLALYNNNGSKASGKTTFYKENFLKTHLRISLDQLHTRNKENKFLEFCLEYGQKFVVDNTNPTKKERLKYIELARKCKFKIIGYYFKSTSGEAIRRNSKRTEKERVPIPGIMGTNKKFEVPVLSEGFDELFQVHLIDPRFQVTSIKDELNNLDEY